MSEARMAREMGAVDAQTAVQPEVKIGFTAESLIEAREKKIMQGQVAIVIGASPEGIGGASARQLTLLGATVVTSSRDKGEESRIAANGFAAKLKEETGSDVTWIPTDVTDENAVKTLVDETVKRFGRIDSVVISPGIKIDAPFWMLSEKSMFDVLNTNYLGPMRVVKTVVRKILRQDPPKVKIVAISSEASVGAPGQANYSGSKAALEASFQAAILDIQIWKATKLPELSGILNLVSPGLTDTPMVRNEVENPAKRQAILDWSHADRIMPPYEVGQLVAYLVSPASGDINGQVVSIIGKGENPPADY